MFVPNKNSDSFRFLLPNNIIYLQDTKSLLLDYLDKRIEDLVFALLKETEHFGSGIESESNQKDIENKETLVKVYDKRTTKGSTWVGLVLRHIPRTTTVQEDIRGSFNKSLGFDKGNAPPGAVPIEQRDIYPEKDIQGKLCTVVSIRSGIEVAEKLCHDWNGRQARLEFIKCHIHPYSSKKRKHDGNMMTQHTYFKPIWN